MNLLKRLLNNKYFIGFALATILLLLVQACQTYFDRNYDMITVEVKDAVLSGHGSGVFIGPNLVLTAAHVVNELISPIIITSDGVEHVGKILAKGTSVDTALIAIDDTVTSWAHVSCVIPEAGTAVEIVGYPLFFKLIHTFGHIASNYRLQEFLPVDATVNGGNSGGPVFNSAGDIIGIVVVTAQAMNPFGMPVPAVLGGIVPGKDICETFGWK